jgi:hypothetical protein
VKGGAAVVEVAGERLALHWMADSTIPATTLAAESTI